MRKQNRKKAHNILCKMLSGNAEAHEVFHLREEQVLRRTDGIQRVLQSMQNVSVLCVAFPLGKVGLAGGICGRKIYLTLFATSGQQIIYFVQ